MRKGGGFSASDTSSRCVHQACRIITCPKVLGQCVQLWKASREVWVVVSMSELEILQETVGPVLFAYLGAHLERDDIHKWAAKAWKRCQRYGQRAGQELAKQAAQRILGYLATEAESSRTQVAESTRQGFTSARSRFGEGSDASPSSQVQSQGQARRKTATVKSADHGMAAIRSLSRSSSSRAIPSPPGGDPGLSS